MFRSRTVWRPNYRMVLSAERVREPAILNPHPGPFPSPNNATSIGTKISAILVALVGGGERGPDAGSSSRTRSHIFSGSAALKTMRS